jgi:hypothetical protein
MVLVGRADVAMASFGKVRGPGRAVGLTADQSGAFGRGRQVGARLAPRPGLTTGGHKMLGNGA